MTGSYIEIVPDKAHREGDGFPMGDTAAPWSWDCGLAPTNLDGIWGMSTHSAETNFYTSTGGLRRVDPSTQRG